MEFPDESLAAKGLEPYVYSLIFLTNVLRLLDERGITKYELADRSGISISFLSDLTNGKANPSLKIMESIAHALGEPLPALLENTDLDQEALAILSPHATATSLPEGYVRVSAILTEFQAFTVEQWDNANRVQLAASQKR
jgi:transcriptional regulator with XRE-family HTH domain